MGLLIPTFVGMALVAAAIIFSPVLHYALAGELLLATGLFVGLIVVLAILLSGFIIFLAPLVLALVYLVIPSFVGVYAGSFVAKGLQLAKP